MCLFHWHFVRFDQYDLMAGVAVATQAITVVPQQVYACLLCSNPCMVSNRAIFQCMIAVRIHDSVNQDNRMD
jgi:hypothetical protein